MDTITNAPSYEWIIEAWLKNNILFPFPKNDIKNENNQNLSSNHIYDDIDEIDMDAINAFFVTNYRDDQIDITTKKLL